MAVVLTLEVFRWSPGAGERMQDYRVSAGPDTTVLDALVEVQRRQDPGLAFRYACRVGMCGSCALVINGRERWACRTRLRALDAEVITVRPLYHFPLIRDLVVDMTSFVGRMRQVGAALAPAEAAPAYELIPGDARERRAIDPAIECIGCGMCVSACTIAGHNAAFPGPAALNRAFTLQMDSRDADHEARWSVLMSDDGLARCHGQGNCTEVCPMELKPLGSILTLRRRATVRLLGFRA